MTPFAQSGNEKEVLSNFGFVLYDMSTACLYIGAQMVPLGLIAVQWRFLHWMVKDPEPMWKHWPAYVEVVVEEEPGTSSAVASADEAAAPEESQSRSEDVDQVAMEPRASMPSPTSDRSATTNADESTPEESRVDGSDRVEDGEATAASRSGEDSAAESDESESSTTVASIRKRLISCKNQLVQAWATLVRRVMMSIPIVLQFIFQHSYLLSLVGLYICGLTAATVFNGGYVLFLIVFLASEKLAHKYWILLVVYAETVILALLVWQVSWTEQYDSNTAVVVIGFEHWSNVFEGLVWHIVILIFSLVQLSINRRMALEKQISHSLSDRLELHINLRIFMSVCTEIMLRYEEAESAYDRCLLASVCAGLYSDADAISGGFCQYAT